jgi:hypothetical protein
MAHGGRRADIVGGDDSGHARMSYWFHSNQCITRNLKVVAPPRLGHRSLTDGGVLRRCSPVIERGDVTGDYRACQAHEEEEELTLSM